MIVGIGIDMVEIARMEKWVKRRAFIEKYFAPIEVSHFFAENKGAQYLATRFAAKEAFGKALGTGLRSIRLSDIALVNDPLGRPLLQLAKSAKKQCQKRGISAVHVSVSHENNTVVVIVICEGGDTPC